MVGHELALNIISIPMRSHTASTGAFGTCFQSANELAGEGHGRVASSLKTLSRWAARLLALAGVLVLLGWLFRSEALMRVFPGFVAMNPLTAACFITTGVALTCFWSAESKPSLLKSRLGQVLADVLILVGLLKLLDYMFGWNFRVDQVFFHGALESDHAGVPNRMAPNTALNFLLSGFVLLLLCSPGHHRSRLAQNLSLVVAFQSLLALLGYVYSANYLYGVGSYIPMAVHTAGLFLLLSLALLFAQTDAYEVALFVSNTPGGCIARRLLPFAFAVPALLGALRLWGEKLRIFNPEFGVTLMVLLCIAAFTALIWWNAVVLNRADRRRCRAETELKKAHDELEIRVQERTGELLKTNEALRAEIAERHRAEQRIREQAEEQKKLEEQFLRAQRMESLGALAGGIAHDLNNALVPILMGSQLLHDNDDNKAERQACLELIGSSAQRCTQMVRQIVNFARGSRGQTAAFQLRHLITEMTKIARDTFPKAISVRSQVETELWNIEGDATELHQVLMNLCVNARDAMPQGGQLTLAAENINLAADAVRARPDARPGRCILLSVSDTGTGIPPEVVTRIFEPFFTTKGPDKGSGLGLSTVANIVKKHRGFVEVESEVGKGTTFKIFLPATESAQAEEATPKHTALPEGRGELILVVDDEQVVLELAKTTLVNYGYRVLTAPNGLEALACFEAHRDEIRLLVTDTDMPFLNGLNAIQAIQKIKPHIPIIVASGATRDTHHLRRIDTTHLIALGKPYNVDQLLHAVAAALKVCAKG